MPATELGSAVISQSILRSGVSADLIDNVVMGNVIQAGNRMNPARQAAVQGGLPVSVPAFTVNRVCGSGAQAIASAAHEVWLGLSRLAVAGGMENMDRAPYLIPNGRWGARMGDTVIQDSMLRDGLNEAFSDEYSGWHTEDLVAKAGLSREEPDRWAARSQQRFARAQAAGRHGRQCAGPVSRSYVDELHLEALARLVAVGVGAVEPGMFGLGPIPAVKQALTRAGWSAQSIDRFEINEAFAAIPIIVARALEIDEELVNVEGGAVAHGHPIGATGAILMVRLLHSMKADGLKRGVATLCIGGGQGIALAVEMI